MATTTLGLSDTLQFISADTSVEFEPNPDTTTSLTSPPSVTLTAQDWTLATDVSAGPLDFGLTNTGATLGSQNFGVDLGGAYIAVGPEYSYTHTGVVGNF